MNGITSRFSERDTASDKEVTDEDRRPGLCTSWEGTESAIKLVDPKQLAGKIVIDVTNPFKPTPTNPFALALGFDDSGGEQVQRWLPKSSAIR